MDPVYATATDMWQMALPPDTLFEDQSIEPGVWTNPTKVGTGSGTFELSLKSNPRSDFSVKVQCIRGGEINVYGITNPGPPPRFIFSLDGGVTFSHYYEVAADGSIAYQRGGFTILLGNSTAPSFVTGDTWSFTTTSSPDINRALEIASRTMDNYFADTYCLPLVSWADDVRMVCCQLARWYLITRRGLDQGQDIKIYYPQQAYDWLCKIATGDLQARVVETGNGFIYPQWMTPTPPFKTYWRF